MGRVDRGRVGFNESIPKELYYTVTRKGRKTNLAIGSIHVNKFVTSNLQKTDVRLLASSQDVAIKCLQ